MEARTKWVLAGAAVLAATVAIHRTVRRANALPVPEPVTERAEAQATTLRMPPHEGLTFAIQRCEAIAGRYAMHPMTAPDLSGCLDDMAPEGRSIYCARVKAGPPWPKCGADERCRGVMIIMRSACDH